MPDQGLRNMDVLGANAQAVQMQGHATNLVNKAPVRAWLWWAIVWMTIFPLVGHLVSIKFHYLDFLGETLWLTFGRLRPVHINGVIFGAFSTPVQIDQEVLQVDQAGIPVIETVTTRKAKLP